jgi:hypothetical protein
MPTPSSHHHKLQDFPKTIRITRNADHRAGRQSPGRTQSKAGHAIGSEFDFPGDAPGPHFRVVRQGQANGPVSSPPLSFDNKKAHPSGRDAADAGKRHAKP